MAPKRMFRKDQIIIDQASLREGWSKEACIARIMGRSPTNGMYRVKYIQLYNKKSILKFLPAKDMVLHPQLNKNTVNPNDNCVFVSKSNSVNHDCNKNLNHQKQAKKKRPNKKRSNRNRADKRIDRKKANKQGADDNQENPNVDNPKGDQRENNISIDRNPDDHNANGKQPDDNNYSDDQSKWDTVDGSNKSRKDEKQTDDHQENLNKDNQKGDHPNNGIPINQNQDPKGDKSKEDDIDDEEDDDYLNNELDQLSKTPVTEPTDLNQELNGAPLLKMRFVKTSENRISLEDLFQAASQMQCTVTLNSGHSVYDALKVTKKRQPSTGWKCDYCGLLCSTGPKLSNHLKAHIPHPYVVKCPTCGLVVNFQASKISNHIKNHQRKNSSTGTMTAVERKTLRNRAESTRIWQEADRKTKQKNAAKQQGNTSK